MSKIDDATKDIIRLLESDGYLIGITKHASYNWYIKNNGYKVMIDRNCILPYKNKTDLTDEELDKDLIEYLRVNIPVLRNYVVQIKDFFKND